jgi:hypothetical protein
MKIIYKYLILMLYYLGCLRINIKIFDFLLKITRGMKNLFFFYKKERGSCPPTVPSSLNNNKINC